MKKFNLDDAINLLNEKGTSLSQEDVEKLVHQLMYQKELNLVYTESVSNLVSKITEIKLEKQF